MPRFLVLWTMVNARVPDAPEDAMKLFTQLTQMVQEDLKAGKMKEWGVFAEGGRGYAIFEGNEVDLAWETGKYTPYVELEARIFLTVDQQLELLRKQAESASM